MFSYIIRLDDACPMMHHENWNRIEILLDKYSVKPIVGIIPDCKDDAADFKNELDDNFWGKVCNWQSKGWIIAQHGLHHTFHDTPQGTKYYQLNIGDYTEFAGVSYEMQKKMLIAGYEIFVKHGIKPSCFFAPAHTYDKNTVLACKELGFFEFISDGYALHPFNKDGMIFLPSIFDTPHKMPFGFYTFIFHPSKMNEEMFQILESFLHANIDNIKDVASIFHYYNTYKKQGIVGRFIELCIHLMRILRK